MKPKLYFPGLDGLRTIACFMVFSFHALGIAHNRLGIQNIYIERFLFTFLNGRNGVSFFFVLSGFLITYILLLEIRQSGRLDLWKFYLRRILRIWPLYFTVLIIVFVMLPFIAGSVGLQNTKIESRAAYYFVFLSNFDVLRLFENNKADFLPSTITWSVAIEEQYYLFWPLFFYFLKSNYFKYIFVFAILGGLLFRLLHPNQPYQLYFHSFSAILDLSIGGAAAYLAISEKNIEKFISTLKSSLRIGLLFAGCAIMFFNSLVDDPYWKVFLTFLQVFFFVFIILDQCYSGSMLLKFSGRDLVSRLGKYTYGIYMLHPLVLLAINLLIVRIWHVNANSPLAAVVCFIAGLPFSVFLAMASYRFIEKRFLLLKNRYSGLPASPIAAVL